ncbi:hypothetical protein GJAV_G00138830 [Gymnothorax javanicus]|nr:hypothetical protein GJAV_G00138830 [Gymnothorax javanicus]
MSSTKRQSSWQEDIARNFSRLFLRSKSQEPQKTGSDGRDVSENVKAEKSSSPDEEIGVEDPQETVVLELSKAVFLSSEGERQEGADAGEEERTEGKAEEGEEEGGGVLDDAGGSPARLAPSPGPVTPTAPLDAFFRKLGSLFHLSSRAEAGTTAVEGEEPADRGGSGTVPAGEGSGDAAEPSGRPVADPDLNADRLLREGREADGGRGSREEEPREQQHTPPQLISSADPESPQSERRARAGEDCRQADLQRPQLRVPSQDAGEDCNITSQGGEVEASRTLERATDEEQQRLALSCPPVVTYGTYRGPKEIRRMRRRNRVQVDSPISEGEEPSRLSPLGKHAGIFESVDAEGLGPGTTTASAVAATPARPELGSAPVMIPPEDGVSQSALLPEREPGHARSPAQPAHSSAGETSGILPLSATEKDSSDERTTATEVDSKAECSELKASPETSVAVTGEIKLAPEQTETLSAREGSTGSPTEANDATALSPNHGSQCSLHHISLSGTQQDSDSAASVPAVQGVDVPESSPSAGECWFLAPETASVEDETPGENALWFESRQMVDNILKNALVALQNIESYIESCEQEDRNLGVLCPILQDEKVSGSFSLGKQREGSFEGAEANNPPVSAVENIDPNEAPMDQSRSSLLLGSESISGLDLDIRNDHPVYKQLAKDEQHPIDGLRVLHPPEFCGDQNGSRSEGAVLQSNHYNEPVLLSTGEGDEDLSDHSSNIYSDENGKLVGLLGVNLESSSKEVVKASESLIELQESVVGHLIKDHLQTDKQSVDNGFVELTSSETNEEAISKGFHLAKDTTKSNSNCHNFTCSREKIVQSQKQARLGVDLNMSNVELENCILPRSLKDESCLSMQLATNTRDRIMFPREAQSKDSVQRNELVAQKSKNIDVLHIPSPALECSRTMVEASIKKSPTEAGINSNVILTSESEVVQDCAKADSSCSDVIGHVVQNGTKEDWQEDHGFALVESYLVTVIEDESEVDDEMNAPLCAGPGSNGADGKQEVPEEPKRQQSPLSHAVQADDDSQQWTSAKAYRCLVISDDRQGSDGPGEFVKASFRDLGTRASGLVSASRRTHLELSLSANMGEMLGPHHHRFHELDFHECEGGFAIINEEDEGDTVFVNDTGPMLSPTTRRGKVYPFSLSPIFEEECSEELQDLTTTQEDLRCVKEQASSILSLLQSVSERLQASSFADPYPDSADELSPTAPPQPLWGCVPDQVDEAACSTNGDAGALSHEHSEEREGSPTCCFVNHEDQRLSPLDRLSGETQDTSPTPPFGENPIPAPQSDSKVVLKSPFYEYLKNARCRVTPPEVDSKCPPSRSKLWQGDAMALASAFKRIIDGSAEKVIARPTQMLIYDGVTLSGEKWEINRDVEDATGRAFPRGVSIRVLRGCWLLYRDPGFRGPCVLLEEGEKILSQDGGLSWQGGSSSAVTIGSIKRAVKGDSTPEIALRTQEGEETRSTEVDNLGMNGSVHLSSLSVKAGCWVAYEGNGFNGNYSVLESGGSISPDLHGQTVTCVRSLRPLRMGGLRVQRPLDPKIVVYEEPGFVGQSRELLGNTPQLGARGPRGAASLRVMGGVWVGYSAEGYRGEQCLLEEGEHPERPDLGGSHQALLSFRFLQADFIEPSISLLRGLDSPESTVTDILDLDVPDLEQAASAGKIDSICVNNGVWVAYSDRSFCGKQYVLEKGTYTGDLDWGGTKGSPASIRAVRLEFSGKEEPRFLLRAYSQPHYQGDRQEYDSEAPECTPIHPMSFRVIFGNWLLFDAEGCSGNHFVLGEGLYPDLISCGCVAASVKSLKPIPYNFSDPSISLYSLDSFEGLEAVVETPQDSSTDFFTQSLRVNSGLWVVYQYSHFKGRQMLLLPGEIPAWNDHSGWDTIGSLYPLKQPRLYILVRNRALGSVLTADILKDDTPPATVSLRPESGLDNQCWVFSGGLLKCKASKACLSLIGGKAVSGARVALWSEHGRSHQKWSLNTNGTISSHLSHQLVLDLKGGTGFDKDHLVAHDLMADRGTQFWDIEMA